MPPMPPLQQLAPMRTSGVLDTPDISATQFDATLVTESTSSTGLERVQEMFSGLEAGIPDGSGPPDDEDLDIMIEPDEPDIAIEVEIATATDKVDNELEIVIPRGDDLAPGGESAEAVAALTTDSGLAPDHATSDAVGERESDDSIDQALDDALDRAFDTSSDAEPEPASRTVTASRADSPNVLEVSTVASERPDADTRINGGDIQSETDGGSHAGRDDGIVSVSRPSHPRAAESEPNLAELWGSALGTPAAPVVPDDAPEPAPRDPDTVDGTVDPASTDKPVDDATLDPRPARAAPEAALDPSREPSDGTRRDAEDTAADTDAKSGLLDGIDINVAIDLRFGIDQLGANAERPVVIPAVVPSRAARSATSSIPADREPAAPPAKQAPPSRLWVYVVLAIVIAAAIAAYFKFG
ncbi:MAG: hypothetical protein WKG01_03835 [Kofleriaceae bacterium]